MAVETKEAPAPAAPANNAPAAAPAPATPPAAPEAKAPPAGSADEGTILGGKPSKEGEGKPDAKPQGAPGEYTDFKLPEGVELNKEAIEGFKALAKEGSLSQEYAQKLVDFQAQNTQKQMEQVHDGYMKQVKEWGDESRKLFGAEADVKFGLASKVIERFGSPELRQLLNVTGLGNHKELLSAFAKIGAAISEDQPPRNEKVATGETKSDGAVLYPNMSGKK